MICHKQSGQRGLCRFAAGQFEGVFIPGELIRDRKGVKKDGIDNRENAFASVA